eukprot:749835-Pelagomonas_calceolata.AAC.11
MSCHATASCDEVPPSWPLWLHCCGIILTRLIALQRRGDDEFERQLQMAMIATQAEQAARQKLGPPEQSPAGRRDGRGGSGGASTSKAALTPSASVFHSATQAQQFQLGSAKEVTVTQAMPQRWVRLGAPSIPTAGYICVLLVPFQLPHAYVSPTEQIPWPGSLLARPGIRVAQGRKGGVVVAAPDFANCWAEVWCGSPEYGRWVHVDVVATEVD